MTPRLGNVLPVDQEKATKLLNEAYPQIQLMISNEAISTDERIYAKFVTGAYSYWGLGNVEKNDKTAFSIIKECADRGHIPAMYDLGYNFYYNGVGTEKDIALSKKYLKMAKDFGLKRAVSKYSEYRYGDDER